MNNKDIKKWDVYDGIAIGVGGYTSKEELQKYVKGKVLEFGCGRGKLLRSIYGCEEKYGIDLSRTAIEYAKKANPQARLLVGDVCGTSFPNDYFDLVYSVEVIEHIENPEKMLMEMKRVLKPGGFVFIQTPNYPTKRIYDVIYRLRGQRKSFKDDYTHVYKFSHTSLSLMAGRYFLLVDKVSRNILGENRFSFIKKIKNERTRLSFILGQKTIVILKKEKI